MVVSIFYSKEYLGECYAIGNFRSMSGVVRMRVCMGGRA
jgi:hypothetical protein